MYSNLGRRSSSFFDSYSTGTRGGGSSHHGSAGCDDSSTLDSAEFAGNYIGGHGRRVNSDKIRSSQSPTGFSRSPSNVSRATPVHKGTLWLQKDGIFCRWKERYFILTRDYLHCFKKSSGSTYEKISDMGKFLFKIKLTDIGRLEWSKGKSTPTIVVHFNKNEKITVRAEDGLKMWYSNLEDCRQLSGERLDFLKVSQEPYNAIPSRLPPMSYTNPLTFSNHGSLRHPQAFPETETSNRRAYFNERTLKELQMVQDYNRKFQRDAVIRKSFNPSCELLFRKPSLMKCGRMSSSNRIPYARTSSISSRLVQISPYDSINSTIGSAIGKDFRSSYSTSSQVGNYKRDSLRRQFPNVENRKSHDFSENVCYRTKGRFVQK